MGWLSTELIIVVVAGVVMVVIIIVAYLLRDPQRAKSCITVLNTVVRAVRGGKSDGEDKTSNANNTRDTINAVLDAAQRLNTVEMPRTRPRGAV